MTRPLPIQTAWDIRHQILVGQMTEATPEYTQAVLTEVADWVYKWLTWEENRQKLFHWNYRRDILSIFTEKDAEDIGEIDEPLVFCCLRKELVYWYDYYDPMARKRGHRRRVGNYERFMAALRYSPVHRHLRPRADALLREEELPHRRVKSDPLPKGNHVPTKDGNNSLRDTALRGAARRRNRRSPVSVRAANSNPSVYPGTVAPALEKDNPTVGSAAVAVAVQGWPRGFHPFPYPNGAVVGVRTPIGHLISQPAPSSQ
ncbi:hypothetical protein V8F20_000102 [Naviculisporaceae sp. PSN 640]